MDNMMIQKMGRSMVDRWSIDKHQKDGQYFDTRGARVETSQFGAYWRMYVPDP